jgi:hypothetical protein
MSLRHGGGAVNDVQEVTVVDIRIPFWSLVVLMFKWALAAIPAMILLVTTAAVVSSVVGAAFLSLLPDLFMAPPVPAPVSTGPATDRRKCEDACDAKGQGVDCYANCAQLHPVKP